MTDSPARPWRRLSSSADGLAAAGFGGSAALGAGLFALGWSGPGEAITAALAGATLTFVAGAGRVAPPAPPAPGPDRHAHLTALTARITEDYPDRIVRSELESGYRRLADFLEELSRGRVCTDPAESGHFLARTENCRRRIRAVTNIARLGTSWWDSPVGREYWRANERALGRGVSITRVFIVADRTEPGLTGLLLRQASAGVEVRLLEQASVPRDLLVNLVVWDDDHAWEPELDVVGTVRRNVFHHEPKEVRRLAELADACVRRGDR